ncbi:CoA transferase [Chelativorans sp. AA-79]|uniref:CaiB/BaiF CoA transferase family protein n=1 Tax=Chelativorans sp. AA-79 TaxID=3028735 RepID=UPI0023F71171|nr:CoA transferase [Chelativorans sp. AA-79]WEX08725.1 CoA transferase [Chelativorans sp. AA-79]
MSGCLSHIRVLDLSRVFAGPWATQILADFGAEVIKVEHPVYGDEARHLGVHRLDEAGNETGETSSFLAMNRGKQSVAIDFKSAEGRELIRRLAAKCDVVVENFKSGTLDRQGLGYEDLKAINPDIIYCSITGFGQTGPYAHLPGYDPLFQAMSGLMSITGVPDGEPGAGPNLVGFSVSDIIAGLYAAIAVLGAVSHRDNGGSGQHIDLSLLDCQMAALSHIGMNYLVSGRMPVRAGAASQTTCPWQAFRCADMDLMIAVGNDRQFAKLCEVLGLEGVAEDARFRTNRDRMAHKAILVSILAECFSRRTAAEWRTDLDRAGVPSSPINNFRQALEDPQIAHREMLFEMPHPQHGPFRFFANPIRYSETPASYRKYPPQLGADTARVLQELLDLGSEEISSLAADKIIAPDSR